MKKILSYFLALLMLLGMVGGANAAEDRALLDFSLMMAYWVDQPLKLENNYLFEKWQEMLDINLDLTLYPAANYVDKAMLKLAGGDLPDVMWVADTTVKTKAVIDAAEAGAFWDCTELLNNDKYPNLKKAISSTMIANATIGGRVYGLPGPRPSARNGIIYRKDLFEKHSIPVPHDMASFYEAAVLLKQHEPDIIPFSYGGNIINFLTVSEGGYNNWGLKDGKLVPAWDTAEYKEVLALLRKMYAEGLMNQDFAIVTGSEMSASMIAGKSAMYQTVYDDYEVIYRSLAEVDPNAELDLIPVFNGTTNAQVGSALYLISKAVPEEKLHRIFQYFDDTLQQEILTWEYYGEEGRNYTLQDGLPVFINDEASKEASDTLLIYKSCAVNPVVIHWPGDTAVTKKWKEATETYAESCVRDYSSPLVSATQTEKGGELDKLLLDARIQYIMGIIDEAGYDAAVASWWAQGGTQIAEEFTVEYQKSLN